MADSVSRSLDILGIRKLPFLTRRNYLYEFRHLLCWSILAGLVEGQFASVIVSRTFHGSPLLIAIASATPFAAYVFSLAWGMLCVGRPKVRLSVWFGAGMALFAATTALVPASPSAAGWFIAQIAAAQVLLAGVITVRSAIWRSNYPVEVRGQITARLQALRSIVGVITVQTAAAICDHRPAAYRYVFPIAAVSGVIGVLMLRRVRIRGERGELRRARAIVGSGQPTATVSKCRKTQTQKRRKTQTLHFRFFVFLRFCVFAFLRFCVSAFGQLFRVLRNDRRFSKYCVAQTLQGAGNLMTIPVAVAVVTRDLQPGGERAFWISTGLIVALPILGLLGSISRWGRLFDGVGVLRFRVVNVIGWAASILFGMFATLVTGDAERLGPTYLPIAVALFALRGLLHGVSQGGGALAWNLGHLHFAKADEAEVYMGIHVFLAGVRGLIAPLAGMWLWTVIGWPVWLIALALALSGLAVYASLARLEQQPTRRRESTGYGPSTTKP
ncbi:MAG: MFS transporter [Planctomycetota bacterium]